MRMKNETSLVMADDRKCCNCGNFLSDECNPPSHGDVFLMWCDKHVWAEPIPYSTKELWIETEYYPLMVANTNNYDR